LKLCEYFDYIAATSTGAIIAAGLSRGMTTSELTYFYASCGKQIFEPAWIIERIIGRRIVISPAAGHVTLLPSILWFELVAADSKGIGAG